MEKKTEYHLFLEGKKPAVLYNPHNRDIIYPFCLNKIIEAYPCIGGIQSFDVKDQILYFQDERVKEEFANMSNEIEVNSPDWHKAIGLILGYPPPAVDYFANLLVDPELETKKAFFDHDGMSFIGNVDDRKVIAKWLHDHISPVTTRCTYMGQVLY